MEESEESHNEEKKDDSDPLSEQAGDAASYEPENGASSSEIKSEARATGEKPRPPRGVPSFYSARFSEHFFPNNNDGGNASPKKLSIFQRYAMSMARRPWTHMGTSFVLAVILSICGLAFGEFKVAIDNAGWWSRGTLISNRASQEILVSQNREALFLDQTGEVWDELETDIQPNWQTQTVGNREKSSEEDVDDEAISKICSGKWYGSGDMISSRQKNLVAAWKTDDAESKVPERSVLDPDALYDICIAEQNTLAALSADDLCYKCDEGCISPYSLVLMARLFLIDEDFADVSTLPQLISCDDLRSLWTPSVQEQFTSALDICVNWSVKLATSDGFNGTITIQDTTISVSNPCPLPIKFRPTLVDDAYPTSAENLVRYTTSYFATKKGNNDLEAMYENSENNKYDRSDNDMLAGVYDTTDEDFYDFYSDAIVGRDMTLAIGSAGVTALAMLVHTKSPFLTMMGLFQIILSFPLAYFVYYFVGGVFFFPFLNFIGIFVVFALGADDVFVAVDKWKNARNELPSGTTEQVAALALPDAAYSMLLTSLTTAVAFFGTAICPVGPIVCFAVFVGLLITLDYLMNILLVFPALCLYDKWKIRGSRNMCVSFNWCCGKKDDTSKASYEIAQRRSAEDARGTTLTTLQAENNERKELLDVEHKAFIHRMLDGYYNVLHKYRWVVLLVCVAGMCACIVVAAQLSLPTSSVVALLPPSNEYERHRLWSQNLLSTELAKGNGGVASIAFGLTAADTGDHLNPDSFTTLVLDDSFNPSSEEAQKFLLGFCDRLFANDFASPPKNDYECPINRFDEWLKGQSSSESPSDEYVQNCTGASSVPVPSEVFNPCIIGWSKLVGESFVLSNEGRVKILEVRSRTTVVYDSPFSELEEEWNKYENWLQQERESAPSGVQKPFHSDIAFYWFDTNRQMLRTAYGAAGIALICAAVVLFVSSKSFILTLFAGISIVYVLVAATACLGKRLLFKSNYPWLQPSQCLFQLALVGSLGFSRVSSLPS